MEWQLLRDLTEAERRQVLSTATRRQFRRGETLFHEGDPADTVHFVAEGHLVARRATRDGSTVTFAVIGPGEAFGDLAMLAAEHRRTSTIAALEPAVTLSLGFADFDRLRSAHPAVERLLVELLAERVARLSDHLLEALHVPAEQRIVRRLDALCARYGVDRPGGVVVPLTQSAVGELAGASRPTTNRVLRRLADDGVLALHRGSIEVLDRAALARHAAS